MQLTIHKLVVKHLEKLPNQKMNQRNRLINYIPKTLLGLAIIGFLILCLVLGGRMQYQSRLRDISRLYPLVIGISLMLPYLIYIITLKSKLRLKLKANSKKKNSKI